MNQFPNAKDRRWTTPDEMDSAFKRASDVWDERIGTPVVQGRNWRLVAILQTIANIVLVCGLIYQSSKSPIIPYLIEVEATGNVRLVGSVTTQQWNLSKSSKHKEIHEWIKNLRAISSDRQVMVSRFAAVRTHSTVAANMQLTEYLKTQDRFTLIGKQTRVVRIEATTTIPGSNNAYRVQWREEIMDKTGVATTPEHFIAEIHLSIVPPKTEAELRANPLGVYVSFFDISKRAQTK